MQICKSDAEEGENMFPEDIIITAHREENLFEMQDEFPYIIRRFDIPSVPQTIVSWHWHQELEWVVVRKGSLVYHTLYEEKTIREGECVWINSNVMHAVAAECPGTRLCYEVHMFRSSFLAEKGSRIFRKYVKPLIESAGITMICFTDGDKMQEEVQSRLLLLAEVSLQTEGAELRIRNQLSELWLLLFTQEQGILQAQTCRGSRTENRLQEMLIYLQEHYQEPVTLTDLASSVHVSKRECLRCFQATIGITPFSWLQDYRLAKACELLKFGDQPIDGIASETGFSSASYFGKVFHREKGCSPSTYRKMMQQGDHT